MNPLLIFFWIIDSKKNKVKPVTQLGSRMIILSSKIWILLVSEFLTDKKWKVFVIIKLALKLRQPTNILITSKLCGPILSDVLILVWNCLENKKGIIFKWINWCG